MTLLRRLAPPHVLAAALCAGLAAALVARPPGAVLAPVAGGLALLAMRLGARRLVALAAALFAAGWWLGGERLERLDASALAGSVGRGGHAVVEVTGPARRSEFAVQVPVRVRRFGRLELSEPARLKLPPERAPPQGAVLDLIVSVVRPRPAEAEGSFDEADYLRRQGVHVVLRATSYRVVGRRGGLGGLADTLRRRISRSMALGLEGERRAVIAGIVLGEDEGLATELRDAFRASGLYHLLAVSGQNVAYVVGGVLLVAWALGVPRWGGHVAAVAAVGGYVLAVGWQPSVVRAGVAGVLASLAWLASRAADRWYFLLVGAAILLGWNPYTLLEPGFQLSFGAVSAIFVAVQPLERRLEGYPLPRPLALVVAVSVACSVATAPIVWLHFGAVPLFSVASNALAAPVVAPLLGMALAATALAPVSPAAAEALAWANGWLAAYLVACARAVAALPFAQLTSLAALGLVALVAGFVWLAFRLPPPRGRRTVALAAMGLTLVAAWRMWSPGTRPPPPPDGLRITILDVGQGDATLIQVPEGAILVDEGPPEARVDEQLRRLGVRRLAALVLTHPSRDNIGGAEAVLERLDVGFVLEPKLPFENPYGRPVIAAARRRGVPVVVTRAGQSYRLGKLRLRVLWPDGSASPEDDPNDHATVLLASYGDVDALLPADAEANVTLPLRPPRVEILKVAHHGSADPQLPALLELVRPRVAVVSVGARNDYGHPAPSTLAALAAFPGLDVYRTDEDGRVVVESHGDRLAVRTEG